FSLTPYGVCANEIQPIRVNTHTHTQWQLEVGGQLSWPIVLIDESTNGRFPLERGLSKRARDRITSIYHPGECTKASARLSNCNRVMLMRIPSGEERKDSRHSEIASGNPRGKMWGVVLDKTVEPEKRLRCCWCHATGLVAGIIGANFQRSLEDVDKTQTHHPLA